MSGRLGIFLEPAVLLNIQELKQNGGPTDEQIQSVGTLGEVLGARGDVLLFGSKKKGEVADLFNKLAKAIAIMSFLPGGISCFGFHFESKAEVK